jgi:hypothetical protein
MYIYCRPLVSKDYRNVKQIFVDHFKNDLPVRDLGISFDGRLAERSLGYFTDEGCSDMVGFQIISSHIKNKANLYLDYIAISTKYQRSGFGTAIMWRLVKQVLSNKESIHLYPANKRLADWYKRFGFYYTNGGYLNFHSYNTRSYKGSTCPVSTMPFKKIGFKGGASRLERCRRWCSRFFGY